jgi:hypothetical protein
MVTVGETTKKIVDLHKNGMGIEEIALQFNITTGNVKKRLKSFERIENGFYSTRFNATENPSYKPSYQTPITWSREKIKEGFELFIKENGRLPTHYEIDDSPLLPSSRQIQRRYGGLSKLRVELGYGDIHLGKGIYRVNIQKTIGNRGGNAEDKLEQMLVEKFGELFVQSEKRFGVNRYRVDFLVYAKDAVLGIDVFATDDRRNIQKNIAIKIPKYRSFPANIPLLFLVWSDKFTEEEIDKSVQYMTALGDVPNLKIVGLEGLLERLNKLEPLIPPINYKPFPRTNS